MYEEAAYPVIGRYCAEFQKSGIPESLALLREDHMAFRMFWNPEAEDFAEMLNGALPDASELLYSAGHFPVQGLYVLLTEPGGDAFLRVCFSTLFMPGDRSAAVRTFLRSVNGRLRELTSDRRMLHTVQDAMVYLSLRYPGECWLCGPVTAAWWSGLCRVQLPPPDSALFPDSWYGFCEDIRECVLSHPGIRDDVLPAAEAGDATEDRQHLLVFDLMRSAAMH